ncbi:hypothetical protein BOX15_Mlig012175g1, partial [Macrostomum lignano]
RADELLRFHTRWRTKLHPSPPIFKTDTVMENPLRWPRQHRKYYLDEEGNSDLAVPAAVKRFKVMNNGAVIHALPGRNTKVHRKPEAYVNRLQQHVFCSTNENYLVKNLLSKDICRPRWYPDDPYEPYHVRRHSPWDYRLYRQKYYP